MKTPRIFIGTCEVGGTNIFLKKCLDAAGLPADSYVFHPHPFGYPVDRLIPLWRGKGARFLNPVIEPLSRLVLLIRALIKYDIFIFLSPSSLFGNNRDLPLLKMFGKKVILFLLGCTDRDPESAALFPLGYCAHCHDRQKQRTLNCDRRDKKMAATRYRERYADLIFAQDDLAGLLKGREFSWIYIPVEDPGPVDLEGKWAGENITIMHLPSNALIKSSDRIIQVLERLREERDDITLLLDTGLSREAVKRQLQKAHIVIDAFSEMAGVLPVEAMSCGCVVIGAIGKWFLERNPGLPVVSTTPDDLYRTLTGLLDNRPGMEAVGRAGREYYLSRFSYTALGNYYKETLRTVLEECS